MAKGYGAAFWGDKNVLSLDWWWPYCFNDILRITELYSSQGWMLHELYFDKAGVFLKVIVSWHLYNWRIDTYI